jgi:hypothetical protein
MTLPFEEKRAINYTRKFLYDLLVPSQTPRVPKEIRDRARSLLRHYPQEYRVDEIMPEEQFGMHNL